MLVFGDQERNPQSDRRANLAPRAFADVSVRAGHTPHGRAPQSPLGRVGDQIPDAFGRCSEFSFDNND